jgi:hypothetical protein
MLSVLLVGRLLAAGAIMPTIATVAARQEPPLTGLAARTAALPPPSWEPNWNLTQSTAINPGWEHRGDPPPPWDGLFNSSNPWRAAVHPRPWGLVALDWSVARPLWMAGGRDNQTMEAVSVAGCSRLKASGQAQRCFIYKNMMRALEWMESQRVLMRDPSKRDFFLQHANGTIVNEPVQYGDQYYWNFTNARAADAFISSILRSVAHSAVDGSYTDDVLGASDVSAHVAPVYVQTGRPDVHCLSIEGLTCWLKTAACLLVLHAESYGAWWRTHHHPGSQGRNCVDKSQAGTRARTCSGQQMCHPNPSTRPYIWIYSWHLFCCSEQVDAGKYNWQAFPSSAERMTDGGVGDQTGGGVPLQAGACVRFMRRLCDPLMQGQPMLMSGTANDTTGRRPSELGPATNQSIAAFLITRPPVAFIGWGWESGFTYDKWSDLFLLQPGTPQALCEEGPAAGVFSRRWSAGTARLDCHTQKADLPFPSLAAH